MRRSGPRVATWQDAHVIVTGGSSGIGRAFARLVVERGARVSVLALADQDLEATVAGLTTARATCRAVGLDVTDRDAVSAGVALATGELGPRDVLLTCAGSPTPGTSSAWTTTCSGGRWRSTTSAGSMRPGRSSRR